MLTTSALLLGLASSLFITANTLLSRLWVKDSDSPLAFSVLYTSISAMLSFSLLVIEPWQFSNTSWYFIGLLGCSALLYGLYDAAQFSARKYVEASSFALLSQLSPIVTILVSVVVFSEEVSLRAFLAIALIVAGNLLAVFRAGSLITAKGLLFSLAATSAVGAAYGIDKVAFGHFPIPLYSVTVYVIPLLVVLSIFASRGGKVREIGAEFRRVSWRAILISFCGVGGYYCLLKTFALTEASIAVPLIYSSTVLATLGGIVLLGERTNALRKIAAAILVFGGILVLRIGS